jgi:hypothetical protein
VTRQDIERRRHVPHGVALDESEAVVVKTAQLHVWNLPKNSRTEIRRR